MCVYIYIYMYTYALFVMLYNTVSLSLYIYIYMYTYTYALYIYIYIHMYARIHMHYIHICICSQHYCIYTIYNALTGLKRFLTCLQMQCNQHAFIANSAKYLQTPMPTLECIFICTIIWCVYIYIYIYIYGESSKNNNRFLFGLWVKQFLKLSCGFII